jgi:hypothetical protein
MNTVDPPKWKGNFRGGAKYIGTAKEINMLGGFCFDSLERRLQQGKQMEPENSNKPILSTKMKPFFVWKPTDE